ncbi:MAG: pilus assembly FimT family protein, partial [Acidimicrobiales bacterium]
MTALGASVRSSRARLVADGDRGLTLVELLVTMLLSAILLGLVISPFVTVTDVTGSAESSSQAAASARAVLADMSSGITSASEICLPTQLTSTQSTTLGNAVRVKTHV